MRLIDERDFARWLLPALILVVFSLVCFYLGYYAAVGAAIARRFPARNEIWNPRRARPVMLVFAAISLLSLFELISESGGLDFYMGNLVNSVEMLMGLSFLTYISKGVAMAAMLIADATFLLTGKREFRLWLFLLLLMTVGEAMFMGFRSAIVLPIVLSAMERYYLGEGKGVQWWLVIVGLILGLIVLPVYSQLRQLPSLNRPRP